MRIFRKLAQLLDVNVAGVADGDALVYDQATGKWIPSAGGSGSDDQTAAEVPFTPAGTIAATDTQSAVEEVATDAAAAVAALSSVYQPLDSDLTSIAALTTTSFGRSLLALANQAALLSAAGAAAASHTHAEADITNLTTDLAGKQPLDSDLTAIAALTTTTFGRAFLAFADEAAFKAGVNLEAGTDFPSLTTFNDHSARHEDGGADEISIAGLSGTSAALQAHLDDTSDAHDASAISVLDTNGDYTATDVEGVLAEIAPQLGGGGGPADGWTAAGETWTYASADDPTFTFTISGDLTAKYSAGMRVKLTQTTDKYFIITKVAVSTGTTTVTIYGGTDYDLANASITNPYWSMLKAPFGFPLDPLKWTVETRSTSNLTQSAPTANTWYNLTNIVVPIGAWRLNYQGVMYVSEAANTTQKMQATLSTANNSESDVDFTTQLWAASTNADGVMAPVFREKTLALAAKTTYYMNVRTTDTNVDALFMFGSFSPTIIRAVCAYL